MRFCFLAYTMGGGAEEEGSFLQHEEVTRKAFHAKSSTRCFVQARYPLGVVSPHIDISLLQRIAETVQVRHSVLGCMRQLLWLHERAESQILQPGLHRTHRMCNRISSRTV